LSASVRGRPFSYQRHNISRKPRVLILFTHFAGTILIQKLPIIKFGVSFENSLSRREHTLQSLWKFDVPFRLDLGFPILVVVKSVDGDFSIALRCEDVVQLMLARKYVFEQMSGLGHF
jgi:hypothetical protein